MNIASLKSFSLGVTAALGGIILVACGAAPDHEATGQSDDALRRRCIIEGTCPEETAPVADAWGNTGYVPTTCTTAVCCYQSFNIWASDDPTLFPTLDAHVIDLEQSLKSRGCSAPKAYAPRTKRATEWWVYSVCPKGDATVDTKVTTYAATSPVFSQSFSTTGDVTVDSCMVGIDAAHEYVKWDPMCPGCSAQRFPGT